MSKIQTLSEKKYGTYTNSNTLEAKVPNYRNKDSICRTATYCALNHKDTDKFYICTISV